MAKRGHHPEQPLNDRRLDYIAGKGLPPIPGLYMFREDGGMNGMRDRTISSRDLAGLTQDELIRAQERGHRLPATYSTPHRLGSLATENQ